MEYEEAVDNFQDMEVEVEDVDQDGDQVTHIMETLNLKDTKDSKV